MSSDYSYDQEGQFYPFFVLVLTGIVTVPLTWTLLFPTAAPAELAPRIKTDFQLQASDQELADKLRAAQKKKARRTKRILFVLVGWALMAAMVYLIVVTQRTVPKIWNPYDILGIPDSADEKSIKKRYKKLSLKFHPDKIRPDPAKNETIESLNAAYVEISKAYQALTDEDVRNNYIQYGHPDGKQSFSIGIALPTFIISGGNGKYIVLLYTLLLGVLLPYLVGSWWYGTQRMSKEGVLMESANNLFREYEENIDENGVVAALSTGKEFANILKGDKAESGLARLESRITESGALTAKDQEKLNGISNTTRRKALALLWAHLGRVRPAETAENSQRFEVGPIAQSLTQSFLAIALAYGSTGPILAAYSACQHIIQAIPPKASPLLQLPYFTPAIVKTVEGDLRSHLTVQQFMSLSEARRRSLAIGKGLLSDSEYKTAMQVARQLPHFSVAKAFFKMTGERYVTPSSLVSLVVKGRVIPPGSEAVPEVNPLDLEDVDAAEDDVEALAGRKKKTVKAADGSVIELDDKPVLPPLTFAPYFYRELTPRWHVFLTDSKQGKMAVPPFTFATFERPIFDEEGKPTFHMQTFKAQFAAPPQPGAYTFVMHLICDSYVGFDTKMQVTLHVEDASKAEEMDSEDEISEPDEDSLAGQMHALKSGSLPGTTKPKRRKQESSSDDESGTDDEGDDTSETNTDTEDES